MPNFGMKGSKEGAPISSHRRIVRFTLTAALLVLGVVPTTMACSGEEAETAPVAPAVFSISLSDTGAAGGEFQPNAFTLSPNQKVTFNITNRGEAIHNMRIAGRDNKYETADDAVSQPEIVKSGGTAVLTWTAPSKAGTYAFRCDYHPRSTGNIVVQ